MIIPTVPKDARVLLKDGSKLLPDGRIIKDGVIPPVPEDNVIITKDDNWNTVIADFIAEEAAKENKESKGSNTTIIQTDNSNVTAGGPGHSGISLESAAKYIPKNNRLTDLVNSVLRN